MIDVAVKHGQNVLTKTSLSSKKINKPPFLSAKPGTS